MKLHVLTAVSRPENLPGIAYSLACAAVNAPSVQVSWHWRLDLGREHVGGQAVKNAALDEIEDGWVWVLDDDTIAHQDVLRTVVDALRDDLRAVIVSQRRTSGAVLLASADAMCPGGVDIGQAFLRRDLIADHRIPIDYNGDGMWLQAVLQEEPNVAYLDEVVSLHNAISGVEVSV